MVCRFLRLTNLRQSDITLPVNANLTEILFILDRSGSMKGIAAATRESFNRFVEEQLTEEGEARLSLLLFNRSHDMVLESVPLNDVAPLTRETYVPNGGTALLDAVGLGIDRLGKRLAAMPESERPGTVIVAILTDGEENASQQCTWDEIQSKIRHQTEVYKWNFLFLGANQDAIATAAQVGIDPLNAAGWVSDQFGIHATSSSFSRKAKAMRKRSSGKDLNPQEALDLNAALSDIVSEEDSKRRKSR